MKRLTKIAATSVLLSAAIGVHAAALDTTTATPDDGILQNFTGIDWHSNGGGWIQGFDLTGANLAGDTDNFTLTYQAFAGGIQTITPTSNLYVASPGTETGSYELTTFSTLQETATCLNDGCTSIEIITNSGSWDIFFDTAPDANQALGTGFTNGVNILSGTWDNGVSTFLASGGAGVPGSEGTGGGFLNGTVTNTNNAYVNPDLLGTTLQASLQFPGQTSPTYTRPAAFNGVGTNGDTLTDFVLQTDTSQSFAERPTQVPEPSILALFGISLLGLSLVRRQSLNRS